VAGRPHAGIAVPVLTGVDPTLKKTGDYQPPGEDYVEGPANVLGIQLLLFILQKSVSDDHHTHL
jgi:hypothetical protein